MQIMDGRRFSKVSVDHHVVKYSTFLTAFALTIPRNNRRGASVNTLNDMQSECGNQIDRYMANRIIIIKLFVTANVLYSERLFVGRD